MSTKSQRAKLLDLLKGRRGTWIPLADVIKAGGPQYGARIFELRGLGHRITNLTQEVDEVRRSWFRLEASSTPTPQPAPAAPELQPESLFGDVSPDRSYRE